MRQEPSPAGEESPGDPHTTLQALIRYLTHVRGSLFYADAATTDTPFWLTSLMKKGPW